MRIILMRHGKPEMPPSKSITANQFSSWIDCYNQAPLCKNNSAPKELKTLAAGCNAIICSNLSRSIESANQLGIIHPYKVEHCLREMEMPSTSLNSIKLSPASWSVILRILWFCGFPFRSESFIQAKIRAKNATALLIGIAEEKESVLFVGHAFLNRYIGKNLVSAGFQCLQSSGRQYWSYGVFERL